MPTAVNTFLNAPKAINARIQFSYQNSQFSLGSAKSYGCKPIKVKIMSLLRNISGFYYVLRNIDSFMHKSNSRGVFFMNLLYIFSGNPSLERNYLRLIFYPE